MSAPMRLVLLALLLLLPACAPRESAGPAAPSAGLTKELARICARDIAARIGGVVLEIEPTGSMLPVLDSRTICVAERLAPTDRLQIGDIVIFPRGSTQTIHRVAAVGADGYVITAGDNTRRSDGWQRPTLRLVATIYSSRP